MAKQQRTGAEICARVRELFDLLPEKTQQGLADKLGIDKSGVTRIVKGKRKEFLPEVIALMEDYFDGAPIALKTELTPVPMRVAGTIEVVGRIGAEFWFDDDAPPEAHVKAIDDEDYSAADQIAFLIDKTTDDGEFRQGDIVIAARFPNRFQEQPVLGDIIIVRRTSPDRRELQSFTLKRAVRGVRGLELKPLYASVEPTKGMLEKNFGLVMSIQRSQRRVRN